MSEPLASAVREADGEPEGAVVLIHGRGSDERDLVPLLEALDPERRYVGVFPRGPLSLPPGGAHWYVVERIGYPEPASFAHGFELLSDLVDGLEERTGVPIARTVVGGFSQGSVMSLALGLGAERPSPAGILALSGFIPTVVGFELDLVRHRSVPVALEHGTHDPVISVEFARAARDRLEAAGLTLRYREVAMGHTIDPAGLPGLAAWLDSAIASSTAR